MIVYFIRHTSVDVPQGVCYGQTDVPLKPSFEEEAAQTSSNLQGLHFDKTYTSPLTRCTRLAAYCGYPDAERDDRIKELNFGDWEMHRFNDISDANLKKWYEDYLHVKATNGESFEDQYKRVADFLNELRQKPYEQVAIFAHGGVLINAQIYAGTLKPEDAFSALTPYGGIIKIEI
ncbi:alpha-ribazole phosphatase [Phocaeicola sp.]